MKSTSKCSGPRRYTALFALFSADLRVLQQPVKRIQMPCQYFSEKRRFVAFSCVPPTRARSGPAGFSPWLRSRNSEYSRRGYPAWYGVVLYGLMAIVSPVLAAPFGIVDARSLAMGGAAVAAAESKNASFYNPSLFAAYDVIEERGRNSRLTSPLITLRFADVIRDLSRFSQADLEGNLRNAITAFNADPGPQTAGEVAAAAQGLQSNLDLVVGKVLSFDAHVGLLLGLAGKRNGGSFFFTTRAFASGLVDLSPGDAQLLDDYVQGLTFLATGGAQGEARPALFDGNGQLLDQTGSLDSRAAGRGLSVSEIGVSLAGEFRIAGQSLLLGVSPKIQAISSVDFVQNVHTDRVTFDSDSDRKVGLNMDLGVTRIWSPQWRAGLVIRDVFRKKIKTSLANTVALDPQIRAGVVYRDQSRRLTVAMDFDLWPNQPVSIEEPAQSAGLGIEKYLGSWLAVRGGMSANVRDWSATAGLGIGAGAYFGQSFFDVGYFRSRTARAASIQFGTVF